MYFKIENGVLVRPPKNDLDTGMYNVDKNAEWLETHGFEDWTDERVAQWHQDHSKAVRIVNRYSKLKIITALKKRDAWNDVKLAITALGYDDEWQACQELASDYEGWDGIIEAFKDRFPEIDVDAVLNESMIF